MSKLIIQLMGGLGNQMFQYAFALAYKNRNPNVNVVLCRYYLDNKSIQDMSPRNYELDIFDLSIHPHKGYIYKCILYHRNLIEHVLGYIYKKMRHIKFLKAPSSAWIYDESMFNNITPPTTISHVPISKVIDTSMI